MTGVPSSRLETLEKRVRVHAHSRTRMYLFMKASRFVLRGTRHKELYRKRNTDDLQRQKFRDVNTLHPRLIKTTHSLCFLVISAVFGLLCHHRYSWKFSNKSTAIKSSIRYSLSCLLQNVREDQTMFYSLGWLG